MELGYNEVEEILDTQYIATSSGGGPPELNEISDIALMLKSFLPKDVKVNITIDDIRQRSNLTNNKTLKFTRTSFFYTILGFTQSHSGPLGDINFFVQLIPGSNRSDKPSNITEIDRVQLKADCINGSIVSGVRETILYSFASDQPPGHILNKHPRVNFLKKIKKSALSHITFYLESDGHKLVTFNNETISFYCGLIKI